MWIGLYSGGRRWFDGLSVVKSIVARGLAPVGLRSSPKICDRFALERGQAPSPQGFIDQQNFV
jgi:hypothetical protein